MIEKVLKTKSDTVADGSNKDRINTGIDPKFHNLCFTSDSLYLMLLIIMDISCVPPCFQLFLKKL